MAKKIINEQTDYEIEKQNNERKFKEMLKVARGDLYVLMDVLDETKISWFIIVKIIRALCMISKRGGGDGWGEVRVEIQADRVVFVRGISSDRIDEPITVENK